jgi:hypothetical protein
MRTIFTSTVMATGVAATLFATLPCDAAWQYHPAQPHYQSYTQDVYNRNLYNRNLYNRNLYNRNLYDRNFYSRNFYRRNFYNR